MKTIIFIVIALLIILIANYKFKKFIGKLIISAVIVVLVIYFILHIISFFKTNDKNNDNIVTTEELTKDSNGPVYMIHENDTITLKK